MLTRFKLFVQAKRPELEALGYTVEIAQSPDNIDSTFLRLDLDSDRVIARIVVHESGYCNMEILDVASESTVLCEYLELEPNLEFNTAFKDFFEFLA